MNKTIREAFQELNSIRVDYVIISEWHKLMSDPGNNIEVLCNNRDLLVSAMNLTKIQGDKFNLDTQVKNHTVWVYQKGNRVFPERFESRLLRGALMMGECFKIPDDNEALYMLLYRKVYHNGGKGLSELELRVAKEFLSERVGAYIKPKYKCSLLHI